MLLIEHKVETTASPAQIWKVWEDVENWNSWDHGLEFSTIDGPFQTGTKGKLKPKGGPLVQTLLTEVEPLKRFVDEARLPGTKIIVSHSMRRSNEKTYVTHKIEMKGPLGWLFAFLIGRKMKKNLPNEMLSMVKKAEGLR